MASEESTADYFDPSEQIESDYYLPEQISNCQSSPFTHSVLHVNLRSIVKNLNKLESLLHHNSATTVSYQNNTNIFTTQLTYNFSLHSSSTPLNFTQNTVDVTTSSNRTQIVNLATPQTHTNMHTPSHNNSCFPFNSLTNSQLKTFFLPVRHQKKLCHSLSLEFCNARSVCNKITDTQDHLTSNDDIDLFFVTESWLNDKISDAMLCPKKYSLLRSDRVSSKGGGVFLMYKSFLQIVNIELPKSFTVLTPLNFEFVCVDLFLQNFKYRFCCFYIPPASSCRLESIKIICKLVTLFSSISYPFFLLGDFNLPYIDWNVSACSSSSNSPDAYFLKFCLKNCLYQHVREPTHIKGKILDLFLCNLEARNHLSSINICPPLSTSDHFIVSCKIDVETKTDPEVTFYFDYKNGNYSAIQNELSMINWSTMIAASSSLQNFYNSFLSILHAQIHKYVPKKQLRLKRKAKPIFIKRLLNKKLFAYKKFKLDKSTKHIFKKSCLDYKNAVNKWNDDIENKICQNPSDKKFYNFINNKLKTKPIIPPLLDENDIIQTKNSEKANLLNKVFQRSFTIDNGILCPISPKSTPLMPSFEIRNCDIVEAVKNMNDKASNTPEEIPVYFIKRIINAIVIPLAVIFNFSLINNVIPTQWKQALITPIHKKGNRNLASNYRPISLTSAFCRIFEAILHKHILLHLISQNLLSPSQYGFLPGKSTCSQLLDSIYSWSQSFFTNEKTSVVYTDIRKAFDSVSHSKLIKVLISYGINPQVNSWIQNFLCDRFQMVKVENEMSQPLKVYSGVPQGSIIGPLLFLIFIDGINSAKKPMGEKGDLKLFADDAKVYSTDPILLQSSLDCLVSWLNSYQLRLAPEKCHVLDIVKPHFKTPDDNFYINKQLLTHKSFIRDLGVIVSEDFTWSNHINHIYQSAATRSFQILKATSTKNIWTLIKIYKTYIRPKVEYNSQVWSPHLLKNKKKIEKIQKHFTKRACYRCGIPFSSYKDRLFKLNLMSLEHRRMYHDLVLFYKIKNGLSDMKFQDYFRYETVNYNLRGNPNRIRPKYNFKHEQWLNCFFVRSCNWWNKLPSELLSLKSLELFKLKLKKTNFDQILIKLN